jgi:hypothetical protein
MDDLQYLRNLIERMLRRLQMIEQDGGKTKY